MVNCYPVSLFNLSEYLWFANYHGVQACTYPEYMAYCLLIIVNIKYWLKLLLFNPAKMGEKFYDSFSGLIFLIGCEKYLYPVTGGKHNGFFYIPDTTDGIHHVMNILASKGNQFPQFNRCCLMIDAYVDYFCHGNRFPLKLSKL